MLFARPSARSARASDDPEARRLRRFEGEILPHLDAAYDLARWLCREADAAEDVVQEAMLRAFRAYDGRRDGGARAWLLAIVRNCHLDWRARNRRRRVEIAVAAPAGDGDGEEGDAFAAFPAEGDPESYLLAVGETDAVHRTLARLSETHREILVLRDLEDCSYREIAEVLAVPIGTVMSRLARARKAFAELWSVETGEGGAP
ncbi:MAG: sigma-70 family RNA polymerase sigma factor [Phyllobacteriaceae bacterium]|nr:sigma-70 family RNA polymerase sigma factor [Phyllobacteriaceae bacterium]